MSELIKRNLPIMKRLRRIGDKKRRQFVRQCDADFLNCISECCENLLKGNVPLTDRQMKTLRSKKQDLRTVAKKSTPLKTKRKIVQKGGFLNLLLPAIIPIVSAILSSMSS